MPRQPIIQSIFRHLPPAHLSFPPQLCPTGNLSETKMASRGGLDAYCVGVLGGESRMVPRPPRDLMQ